MKTNRPRPTIAETPDIKKPRAHNPNKLQKNTRDPRTNNAVIIGINRTCNNDCIFCTDNTDRPELNTSSDAVIKRIRSLGLEPGSTIILSGGEPTEQEGISRIISGMKQDGYRLQMITNGRRFSDKIFAKELADAGLERIVTEIHSMIPEVHDFITQRPGSFKETIEGIENSMAFGVAIDLKIILNRVNYKTAPQIVKYICKKFPKTNNIQITSTNLRKNALRHKELLAIKFSETAAYVEKSIDIAKKSNMRISISKFPICIFSKKYFRYLYLNSRQIYFEAGNNEAITERHHITNRCASCKVMKLCSGLWNGYISIFGVDELKPIKSKGAHKRYAREKLQRG